MQGSMLRSLRSFPLTFFSTRKQQQFLHHLGQASDPLKKEKVVGTNKAVDDSERLESVAAGAAPPAKDDAAQLLSNEAHVKGASHKPAASPQPPVAQSAPTSTPTKGAIGTAEKGSSRNGGKGTGKGEAKQDPPVSGGDGSGTGKVGPTRGVAAAADAGAEGGAGAGSKEGQGSKSGAAGAAVAAAKSDVATEDSKPPSTDSHGAGRKEGNSKEGSSSKDPTKVSPPQGTPAPDTAPAPTPVTGGDGSDGGQAALKLVAATLKGGGGKGVEQAIAASPGAPGRQGPGRNLVVVGAGFGRTGTTSLKVAVEQLTGGKCYHMSVVVPRGKSWIWAKVFRDGWEAHKELAMSELGECTGAVDLPPHLLYRELSELNPNAKVVLTERDFDRWYESAHSTIYPVYKLLRSYMATPYMRWLMREPAAHLELLHHAYFGPEGVFKGQFEDKEVARQAYQGFQDMVRASVPPEQLLVYKVAQGWEPLCDALGLPVPDTPFPNVNDSMEFQARNAALRNTLEAVLYGVPLAVAAVVAGLAAGLRWFSHGRCG